MSRWDGLILIMDIPAARNCFMHMLMGSKCMKWIVPASRGNYSFETLADLLWRTPIPLKRDPEVICVLTEYVL